MDRNQCKALALFCNNFSAPFDSVVAALVETWLSASFSWTARAGLPAVLGVLSACLERSRDKIRAKSRTIACRNRISISFALVFTVMELAQILDGG